MAGLSGSCFGSAGQVWLRNPRQRRPRALKRNGGYDYRGRQKSNGGAAVAVAAAADVCGAAMAVSLRGLSRPARYSAAWTEGVRAYPRATARAGCIDQARVAFLWTERTTTSEYIRACICEQGRANIAQHANVRLGVCLRTHARPLRARRLGVCEAAGMCKFTAIECPV